MEELVAEAYSATADGFMELLEEASRLQGREGQVEGCLVRLRGEGELIVVGDIHGDLHSLAFILSDSSFMERAERGEDVRLAFLGDYGDRGAHSVEVYYVLFKLKATYPDRVVLLRGNHEGPPDLLASPHDLPFQVHRKFPGRADEVYSALRRFFDRLHLVALIEGRYVMLHGGAPGEVSSIEEVASAARLHPSRSILEEILWSDPVDYDGLYPSPRGAGRLFGPDVTSRFLEVVGAKVLIRGHEPCPGGVEVRQEGRVVTVFSRKGPPYMNPYAAYLRLDASALKDGFAIAMEAVRF